MKYNSEDIKQSVYDFLGEEGRKYFQELKDEHGTCWVGFIYARHCDGTSCKYADKFYNGKFYTESSCTRHRHPEPYSTYKVKQMDEIMLHEIFSF